MSAATRPISSVGTDMLRSRFSADSEFSPVLARHHSRHRHVHLRGAAAPSKYHSSGTESISARDSFFHITEDESEPSAPSCPTTPELGSCGSESSPSSSSSAGKKGSKLARRRSSRKSLKRAPSIVSISEHESAASEVDELIDRRSFRASRASRASAMTYASVVTYASRSAYSSKNRSSYQPSRASVQTYGSSVLTYGSRASAWFGTPPQRNSKFYQDDLPGDDNSELVSPIGKNIPRPSHPLPWAPRLSSVSRRPLPPLPTPTPSSASFPTTLSPTPNANANDSSSSSRNARGDKLRPLPRPPPSLTITQSSSPEPRVPVGRVVNSYKGGRRSLRFSTIPNGDGSGNGTLAIGVGATSRRGSSKPLRRAGTASAQSSRAVSMVHGLPRALPIPGVDELVALLNEADAPVETVVIVEGGMQKGGEMMGDASGDASDAASDGDVVDVDPTVPSPQAKDYSESPKKPKLQCTTTARASLAVPSRFSLSVPPISPGLTTPLSPGNETGASSILRAVAEMDFPLPPSPVIPPLPEDGLKLKTFTVEVPKSAPPTQSEIDVKGKASRKRRNTLSESVAPSSAAAAKFVASAAAVLLSSKLSKSAAQTNLWSKPAPKPIDVEAANRYDVVSVVATARSTQSSSGSGSMSCGGSHSSSNYGSVSSCSSVDVDDGSEASHDTVKTAKTEKTRSLIQPMRVPMSAPAVMPLKIRRGGSKAASMLAPTGPSSYSFAERQSETNAGYEQSASPSIAPLRFKQRDSKVSTRSVSGAGVVSDGEAKDADAKKDVVEDKITNPSLISTKTTVPSPKSNAPTAMTTTVTVTSTTKRVHATPALIPLPSKPNPIQIPSRPRLPYAQSRAVPVPVSVALSDNDSTEDGVKTCVLVNCEEKGKGAEKDATMRRANTNKPLPSPTPTPLTASLAGLIATPPATGSKVTFSADSSTLTNGEVGKQKPKLRLITSPALPSVDTIAKEAIVDNRDNAKENQGIHNQATPPLPSRSSSLPLHAKNYSNSSSNTTISMPKAEATGATTPPKPSYAFLSEPLFSESKPVMLHNLASNLSSSFTTVPFVLPTSTSNNTSSQLNTAKQVTANATRDVRRISNAPPSMPSLAQIHARRLNRLTPDDPRSPMLSEAVKAVNLASQECKKRRLGEEQDDKHPPSSFFHHLDVDAEGVNPEAPRPHIIRLSMSRRAGNGNAPVRNGVNKGIEGGRIRRRTRTPLTGSGFFGSSASVYPSPTLLTSSRRTHIVVVRRLGGGIVRPERMSVSSVVED